ncbi:MAG: ABC transporter permease [Gammaproteobacteria bacterium]
MFWNILLLAFRAISRNLLRSALTILGIVIGVAAVITMVNLGRGATLHVTNQIASLGSNLLIVRPGQRVGPGQRSPAPPFTIKDSEAMANDLPGVAAVSPTATRNMVVVYGNLNWSTSVTGTDNHYFDVRNTRLAAGRKFSESELRAGSAVCIIGETVRRELFGNQDPIGARLRLNKIACDVIGLTAAKGQTTMGSDQDDILLMPLRTFWRRIAGNRDVALIQLSARDGVSTAKVKSDIESLLRERRRISAKDSDNFFVHDMQEITSTLTGTTQVLTGLLGAVAAVSLLVGGIGIMNIMLVSVTERTREIGIRLAIGAQEQDVLLQFLVEAVVLSSLGGLVGILLAVLATYGLAGLMGVPIVLSSGIMVIAFFFSAAVGVLFGYIPARKAAKLNPIDALRHE